VAYLRGTAPFASAVMVKMASTEICERSAFGEAVVVKASVQERERRAVRTPGRHFAQPGPCLRVIALQSLKIAGASYGREKTKVAPVACFRDRHTCLTAPYAVALLPSACASKFSVMRCTRGSGPCGRTPCDQGNMWPGGEDRPCAHQIVDALNTKFLRGPG
jgi:hypothetical protein